MRLLTAIIALLWMAAAGWYGWSTLPQLPLDSGSDPATLEALNDARLRHGAVFALVALVPALIVLAIGRRLTAGP